MKIYFTEVETDLKGRKIIINTITNTKAYVSFSWNGGNMNS
jgi:hypothetical protein